jgi:hypothetical protein
MVGRKSRGTGLENEVPKEHKPNGADVGRKEPSSSHTEVEAPTVPSFRAFEVHCVGSAH